MPDDAPEVAEAEAEVAARVDRLLSIDGTRTVDSFHRELGHVMWDYCGMERSDEGLRKALDRIPELRREFWNNVKVPGSAATLNQSLEKAGRVADFLELGELMCLDALHRTESCGGHFRAESQTDEGEARRDDENFSYVAAWEYTGQGQAPVLHKEDLVFEYVTPSQRSYKSGKTPVKLKLRVWRQAGPDAKGRLVNYEVDNADEDMSFLELIDVLNEKLILAGDEPVAFDQDCREGICGSCDMVVNGYAHGPQKATTVCQLHLRHFRDGETITVEPWRSTAFPVLKDLVVDRAALDRIVAAGGYVSAPTGSAPEARGDPGAQAERGPGVHRRRLHRLRGLRGRLPERLGARCSSAPRSRTSPSCRRGSPSGGSGWSTWSTSTTPRASAAAPTSGSAPRRARRRSRST